jgi:hypothetical protein
MKIGTGITEREISPCTGPFSENDAAYLNSRIAEAGYFAQVSGAIQDFCAAIAQKITDDDDPITDSPEDFALRILARIKATKSRITPGETSDHATRSAFEAGMLWGTATMKWQWELDALRGAKAKADRQRIGRETGEKKRAKADKWREPALLTATSMRKKNPRIGQKQIAKQICSEIPNAPELDYVVQVIRKWEKNGILPRSIR